MDDQGKGSRQKNLPACVFIAGLSCKLYMYGVFPWKP